MKLIFSHFLTLCIGLATGAWWFAGSPRTPAKMNPIAVSSADGVPFGELGLRSGDLLKSVNGVTSPDMMSEMAKGHERGQLCVIFERAGTDREICLKQGRTASAH